MAQCKLGLNKIGSKRVKETSFKITVGLVCHVNFLRQFLRVCYSDIVSNSHINLSYVGQFCQEFQSMCKYVLKILTFSSQFTFCPEASQEASS